MATKVAVLRKKDPFAVVGEAMIAAADAVKKSTSDARHAASQAVPAVRSAVAQSVYVLTYYTSFGVVFAALAVSRMTPLDNAFGYGIRDGAAAARDAGSRGGARKSSPRIAARKRTETRRARPRTGSKNTGASVVEAEP
jgi:hypothetical protein